MVAAIRKTRPWPVGKERNLLNEIEAANPALTARERRKLFDQEMERRWRTWEWDHRILEWAFVLMVMGGLVYLGNLHDESHMDPVERAQETRADPQPKAAPQTALEAALDALEKAEDRPQTPKEKPNPP